MEPPKAYGSRRAHSGASDENKWLKASLITAAPSRSFSFPSPAREVYGPALPTQLSVRLGLSALGCATGASHIRGLEALLPAFLLPRTRTIRS